VEAALDRTADRFRKTQSEGGWGYQRDGSASTAAMTCAGLLALAVGMGNKSEEKVISSGGGAPRKDGEKPKPINVPPVKPLTDPQIQLGLKFVRDAIVKDMNGGGLPPGMPAQMLNNPQFKNMYGGFIHTDLYCVWSIERVGMIFGLTKNELGVDWFLWGSEHLVKTQRKDGAWEGKYGPDVDTAFGLMFMRRANLVKDLSILMGNKTLSTNGGKKPPAGSNPPAGSSVGPKIVDTPKIVDNPKPVLPTNLDPEVHKLVKALIEANGAKQVELVKEYGDAEGSHYTTALLVSIPLVPDDARKEARDALATRLASRLKAEALKKRLQDENPELRRAAALAVYMADQRGLIMDLIACLDDSNEMVVRAAHTALKSMAKQDFGPNSLASTDDRAKAVAAWKEWAKTQK
jgi:hypothetical protein